MTDGGTPLYLIKQHVSQGPKRRRLDAEMPEELRDLTDEELADRNARVWAVVLADCQRAAGVELDAYPNTRGGDPRRTNPVRAALLIAVQEYGIPYSRLAELAERSVPDMSRSLVAARRNPKVTALVEAWERNGGREHVQRSAVSRQVDVPAHVYDSLARRAERAGVSIEALLASIIGLDG
jgi:hypothetical protein